MDKSEVKKFYDSFGKKQDWQGFYENKAINKLIENSDFENARSIFEFGCGTGKFAKVLLKKHLSKNCQYIGIDLSETMYKIASERLKSIKPRAKIQLSNGSTELGFPDNYFDRFVSNYVLDILSDEDIKQIFSEANRVLVKNGLLCLISLACGEGFVSKQVSSIWEKVHKLKPTLVGGCRPLNLIDFVNKEIWQIKHHSKIKSFGITSEVLILKK